MSAGQSVSARKEARTSIRFLEIFNMIFLSLSLSVFRSSALSLASSRFRGSTTKKNKRRTEGRERETRGFNGKFCDNVNDRLGERVTANSILVVPSALYTHTRASFPSLCSDSVHFVGKAKYAGRWRCIRCPTRTMWPRF